VKDYQERQWNHICWRSDGRGKKMFFINGVVRHNFSDHIMVIPSENRSESSFLIGQEPDTLRGNFNNLESFRGKISGLNIWNFSLSDKDIEEIASCKKKKGGNVIKWEENGWTYSNTSPTKIGLNELCLKSKKIYLFPFKTDINEAFDICHIHGGELFVPKNEDENENLKTMIEPYLEICDPVGRSDVAWLGITRETKEIHEKGGPHVPMVETTSKSQIPLNFSNWDMLPKTIDNCVIFRSNGVWDSKNEMFCPDIKTCPVCSFSSVPKLTMLGLPPESAIDYYWYLDKDKNGTIYYDGYKI